MMCAERATLLACVPQWVVVGLRAATHRITPRHKMKPCHLVSWMAGFLFGRCAPI